MAAGDLAGEIMRFKAVGEAGHFNGLYVPACAFPRDRYATDAQCNQYTAYRCKDRQEILAYIKQHGPCSVFDLELCLHQENAPVMRHLAALQARSAIERCYFGGEKYRVIL